VKLLAAIALVLASCTPTPWLVRYRCTPHPGPEIADEDGTYRLVRESDQDAPCARVLYEGNGCTLEYERCTCGGLWLQRSKVCTRDGQTTEAVDETVCFETKIMQGTLVVR
jgi:hypothetical protein